MKNVLLALVTVIGCNAFAAGFEELRSTRLGDIQLDEKLNITADFGFVTITGKREVSVSLYRTVCPKPVNGGFACLAVPNRELEVTVPVKRIGKNSCGATVYRGKSDRRPVDGALEQVTVIDNTTNTCVYIMPIPMTQVIYRTETMRLDGKPVRTESRFSGDVLEIIARAY